MDPEGEKLALKKKIWGYDLIMNEKLTLDIVIGMVPLLYSGVFSRLYSA